MQEKQGNNCPALLQMSFVVALRLTDLPESVHRPGHCAVRIRMEKYMGVLRWSPNCIPMGHVIRREVA
jgi:hypothetical protein